MLLLKSFRCLFEICLQFLLKRRLFKWKCLGHLLFKGSHIWLNHLKWTDCWSEELNGDSLAWDRIRLFVGEYLGSCWGRTLAAMADPSKQQKPSLLTWTSAWAACWWEPRPALPCSLASSQRSPTTIVLHLFHSQPLYLVMRLRLCDARHSRWVNVEVFFFKVNLEAEVSLYESVFVKPVADHMTPCCTVWLGPDLQAFPVSSGVTSTITLLLFCSHEPLCQSSQNQADGARWQQKACKSWIIWLEILFNYSTKWPSWIQINTCSPLYNMCKQLLQF